MDVMITTPDGLRAMCDTEGCGNAATATYSTGVMAGGHSAGQRLACDEHNPYNNVAIPLPVNFTSLPLCHACGQPVRAGALVA